MKEKQRLILGCSKNICCTFRDFSTLFFLNSGFYNNIVAGKRMFVMVTVRGFLWFVFLFFIMLTGYLMSKKELSPKYYCGIVKTLATYVLASIACIIFKKSVYGWGVWSKRKVFWIFQPQIILGM